MEPQILLAEGDLAQANVLKQFLSRQGLGVEMATDGLECLDKLRHLPIEAVVLNLELPWGGGDGVLAVMRHDPRLKRIPVILTSGDAAPDAMYRQATHPVLRALWKPFSQCALLEGVRYALQKPSSQSRMAEGTMVWDPILAGREFCPAGVI